MWGWSGSTVCVHNHSVEEEGLREDSLSWRISPELTPGKLMIPKAVWEKQNLSVKRLFEGDRCGGCVRQRSAMREVIVWGHVSYVSCHCDKIPWPKQLQREGTHLCSQFKGIVPHSRELMVSWAWGSCSPAISIQEAGRDWMFLFSSASSFRWSPGPKLREQQKLPSGWVCSSQLT